LNARRAANAGLSPAVVEIGRAQQAAIKTHPQVSIEFRMRLGFFIGFYGLWISDSADGIKAFEQLRLGWQRQYPPT
jgi:hypothetical protein